MGAEESTDWRQLETATASELADGSRQPSALEVPGLTVLCHPDPDRVGEQAPLVGLRRDGEALLSRLTPDFKTPDGDRRGPLADPCLSRQPLRLTPGPGGGLTLDAGATRTRLTIGGEAVDAEETGSAIPARVPETAPRPTSKVRTAAKKYRDPGEVGDDELLAALRAHHFRLQPAARALGVSRASLYVLIDACPQVRKASDLGREEIEAMAERCGGRVEAMAEALEVSKQGLKMRMTELGLR